MTAHVMEVGDGLGYTVGLFVGLAMRCARERNAWHLE
jgi:hypothetical protein